MLLFNIINAIEISSLIFLIFLIIFLNASFRFIAVIQLNFYTGFKRFSIVQMNFSTASNFHALSMIINR